MTHRHPLTLADCRFLRRASHALLWPLAAFALSLTIHQLFVMEAALAAASGV
ncbi:hypothetical protein [Martelella sp. HB161492]|uniref:hypothetical protein n=1 Tax=Martelella sp. HB161492 TaxID=2720726 RepID=UPI001591B51B|nr:hypothetical protein [Martelella sp. HB161492]